MACNIELFKIIIAASLKGINHTLVAQQKLPEYARGQYYSC